MTEYGDMRSFLSKKAQPGSHGASVEIVPAFDCLDKSNDGVNISIVKFLSTSLVNVQIFKTIIGKGLLLRNLDKNVTIGFGIITTAGLPFVYPIPKDLTAICQGQTSLSMLFYSNI